MKRNATAVNVFIWHLGIILLVACGCRPGDHPVEVSVAVDFGPANRAAIEKKLAVPERSTVFDALQRAFPVATSGR
jgi:hypothetical protein